MAEVDTFRSKECMKMGLGNTPMLDARLARYLVNDGDILPVENIDTHGQLRFDVMGAAKLIIAGHLFSMGIGGISLHTIMRTINSDVAASDVIDHALKIAAGKMPAPPGQGITLGLFLLDFDKKGWPLFVAETDPFQIEHQAKVALTSITVRLDVLLKGLAEAVYGSEAA